MPRRAGAWIAWMLCAACASRAEPADDDAGVDAASDAALDAAIADDGGDAGAPPSALPCEVSDAAVRCDARMHALGDGTAERRIYWQAPASAAPPEGYPIVLLFQGSLFGPSLTWVEIPASAPFGGYYQGLLQARLLEAGFVVIAPEASGGVAWTTNAGNYDASADRTLMLALLDAIEAGDFGAADLGRLYATGISSGGYMTSRMAVSHPGVFAALAIQSASYATCLGPLCAVPAELPADHPPTLFLHGEQDTIVPIATAQAYYDALRAQGVESEMVVDAAAGHAWLEVAPERILEWFEAHSLPAQ